MASRLLRDARRTALPVWGLIVFAGLVLVVALWCVLRIPLLVFGWMWVGAVVVGLVIVTVAVGYGLTRLARKLR